MNWSVKPESKEGDLRICVSFLFLPLTIDKQVKWWELACWVELYQRGAYGGLFWVPQSWRTLPPMRSEKGFLRSLYIKFFSNQQTRIIQ